MHAYPTLQGRKDHVAWRSEPLPNYSTASPSPPPNSCFVSSHFTSLHFTSLHCSGLRTSCACLSSIPLTCELSRHGWQYHEVCRACPIFSTWSRARAYFV